MQIENDMNHNACTIRSTDLQNLLNVSDRSVWRWMHEPYPRHATPKNVRTYALPEVVARLRLRRKNGLSGDDLHRVVTFDTVARAKREIFENADFMWLGDAAEDRAKEFRAAIEGEGEAVERARAVQKEVRVAAMQAGLPGVERLRQSVLTHPGVARFVLTGEANELPASDAGWLAFTKALWAVNPNQIQLEAA